MNVGTQSDISILLGNSTLSNRSNISWMPKKEKNPHLLTVGASGSGKTETLKSIIFELRNKTVNCLIFDFHNDFNVLSENTLNFEKATLHPFEIQPNEMPLDVVYRVSKMIANLFRFGEIQESIIRDAIKIFYKHSGIRDLKKCNNQGYDLLPFSDFLNILQNYEITGTDVKRIIAKLSILFDVDLFMNADANSIPFERLIKGTTVLNLLNFPTDEVKSFIADLLLKKLINHLYMKGKSENIWLYCFIDEAHRMMYPDSSVELLLREARKYGVGLILASQRPTDFSETILANVATILAFQSSLNKDAVFLSNHLRVDKENFQKLNTPGLGYCLFSSDNLAKKIQIIQAKDREGYKKLEEQNPSQKEAHFDEVLIYEKRYIEKIERLTKENEIKSAEVSELQNKTASLNTDLKDSYDVISSLKRDVSLFEKKNITQKNIISEIQKMDKTKMKLTKPCSYCSFYNLPTEAFCGGCGKGLK